MSIQIILGPCCSTGFCSYGARKSQQNSGYRGVVELVANYDLDVNITP